MNGLKMNRRDFAMTAAIGGGLAFGFRLPGFAPGTARAQAAGAEINSWIVIAPDNTVTIRIARPEVGQGSANATAQFIAEELDAAQDERTHQDVAQLGIVLHDRHQVRAIELDDFARLGRPCAHQRGTARQHVGLARELARPVLDDELVRGRPGAGADDFHGAARDDEEGHPAIAGLDKDVAAFDGAGAAVPADARHLVNGEFRKDVLESSAARESGWDRVVGHAALNTVQCMRGSRESAPLPRWRRDSHPRHLRHLRHPRHLK